MPLTTLLYTPAITGSTVDTYIKSQCVGIDPNKQNIGLKIQSAFLTQLYNDFSTTLQTAITTYLNQAIVMFPGAPSTPIIWGPIVLAPFKGKVQSSAQIIDSQTKSQCVGKQPEQCSKIYYTILCAQIFKDICDIISIAVANAGNSSTVIVPPGAIAPPHTGTVAPMPATLQIPYDANLLKTLLSSTLNQATATSLSNIIDNKIRSSCIGKNETQCGSIIHDVLLTEISTKLKTELQTHIKNFVTQIKRYIITLGSPGTNPNPPPPILPTTGIVFGIVQ